MHRVTGWFGAHWRHMLLAILILAALGSIVSILFYMWMILAWSNPPHISYQAAMADLDGDGDLDAVLANGVNEHQTANTVWINQGGAQGGQSGTFADSGQRLGFSDYRTVAVGDIDRDGDLDVLMGDTYNKLELFFNLGGAQGGEVGQLGSATSLYGAEFWGGPHPIGLGDLDGDGDLDILSGNCCGGLMMRDDEDPLPLPASNWMWINQAVESEQKQGRIFPSFQSVQFPLEEADGTQAIALGDLDSDGDLDALLAKTITNNGPDKSYVRTFLRVWWNDGQGRFKSGELNLETPGVTGLALGDLDEDGDLDALVATVSGGLVILNQGGAPGQFILQPGSLGSQRLASVALGDLNGDGSLDALLTSAGRAQPWLNDGRGSFSAQATLRTLDHSAAALGDLNGDGSLDIFTAVLAEDYQVWWNDGKGRFFSPANANKGIR